LAQFSKMQFFGDSCRQVHHKWWCPQASWSGFCPLAPPGRHRNRWIQSCRCDGRRIGL